MASEDKAGDEELRERSERGRREREERESQSRKFRAGKGGSGWHPTAAEFAESLPGGPEEAFEGPQLGATPDLEMDPEVTQIRSRLPEEPIEDARINERMDDPDARLEEPESDLPERSMDRRPFQPLDLDLPEDPEGLQLEPENQQWGRGRAAKQDVSLIPDEPQGEAGMPDSTSMEMEEVEPQAVAPGRDDDLESLGAGEDHLFVLNNADGDILDLFKDVQFPADKEAILQHLPEHTDWLTPRGKHKELRDVIAGLERRHFVSLSHLLAELRAHVI